MKHVVAVLDIFKSGLDLPYLLSLPIPFIDDLFEAQVEYLQEKKKAQEEAYKAVNGG